MTAALHPWQGDVGNTNPKPVCTTGHSLQLSLSSCFVPPGVWTLPRAVPNVVFLSPPGSSRQHRPPRPPKMTPGRMGATESPESLWSRSQLAGHDLSEQGPEPCPCRLCTYHIPHSVLSTAPTSLCSARSRGWDTAPPLTEPRVFPGRLEKPYLITAQLQPWGRCPISSQGCAELGVSSLCHNSELVLLQSSWRVEIVT